MNCLVAIARKPGLHPYFQACLDKYAIMFPGENKGWTFQFEYSDIDGAGSRLAKIARARNELLDRITDEHDYVLILDADIVALPFNLPSVLHSANPDGITAPLILIEGGNRFYDTSGFLENGAPVSARWPYFDAHKEYVPLVSAALVDLDSVGCVYLAPAALFRDGVHYSGEPRGLTDHEEVCAAARERGMRVACLSTVAAHHAFLPLYGEQWR